ncbi:cytochrome P450 alkane hydroxylase-like protein [Xylaria arbuscula]|nr:cytochrome P450 alkane hydroxylase-like protein [Xylaria arbuscula]
MAAKWTATIAVSVVSVFFVASYRRRRKISANEMSLACLTRHHPLDPILGMDFQIAIRGDISLLHKFHERYGQSFKINPWIVEPSIFTIAPENLKVMSSRDSDWGIQPARLPAMEHFCGRGFLTTDGLEWRAARQSIRPVFAKSNAVDIGVLRRELNNMCGQIPTDGSTVDLQPLLYVMFLNTSLYFLMGICPDTESSQAPCSTKEFIEAFHSALFWTMVRIVLGGAWRLVPQGKYLRACRTAHSFIDHYIEQGLRESERGHEENINMEMKVSLIDYLAASTNDVQFIRSQTIQGMMASQETTSALLGNTIFLLARHRRYWQQIREEALVLGEGNLTLDGLHDNRVFRNILLESLRLYPIFPLMGRVALRDTTLPVGGGPDRGESVFVPKGTKIEACYYALHRDPDVFGKDVEAFRPERWESINPRPWEFMGFGGGSRACLGQQKSLTEASFVLASLAIRFETLESRDDRDWKSEMKLTCQNANGCKIAFTGSPQQVVSE